MNPILWLFNFIARIRPARRIEAEDGALYLLRVKLRGWMPGDPKTYRWSAYLHRFYLPDLDRALHNHPWRWAISIILWGGYAEERRLRDGTVVTRRVRPLSINFLWPEDFHRVSMLHGKETWTLFITGKKFKGWGFLVPGFGFKPYSERFAERGISRPDSYSSEGKAA